MNLLGYYLDYNALSNHPFSLRCTDTQVDFRCPSIGDICNFLWFLFNTKNGYPSTIEGYRTAIAETLGNSVMDISNNADIARLSPPVFTGIDPKAPESFQNGI